MSHLNEKREILKRKEGIEILFFNFTITSIQFNTINREDTHYEFRENSRKNKDLIIVINIVQILIGITQIPLDTSSKNN